MDLLVDLCRIANRAADLLTQKGSVLFAQPMNPALNAATVSRTERLNPAQADLKLMRHLFVRRRSYAVGGIQENF
jgi:hypothetical protein